MLLDTVISLAIVVTVAAAALLGINTSARSISRSLNGAKERRERYEQLENAIMRRIETGGIETQ